MKITIIIPYKNAAKYIGRCANSLRKQDGDFEFIFVNDNSSDDPVFETDDRFVLVDNKHKPGVSGARNTGLDIASGDWISFLDADDVLNDGAFKIFEYTIKAGGDHNIFQFNHFRHYAKINRTALKYTNGAGDYTLRNLPALWYVVWNKLYKAEFLKDIRFNESMKFGEDELFNLDCLARDGRIRCFSYVTTTHYFENEQSLSKIRGENDMFKMNRMLSDFVKEHKDPEIRRAVCLRISTHWSNLFFETFTGMKNGKRIRP